MRRLLLVACAALGVAAAAPAGPLEEARRADQAHAFSRARRLWLPLARAGSAEAAFRLGLLDDLGEGGPEDASSAYHWFRQAAAAGDPEAQFNVAVMDDSGRGTAHDTSGAAEWYARAAVHGQRRAQYNLALLYRDGDGVPRNLELARAWFRLAASNGLTAAAQKLGRHDPEHGSPVSGRQQSDVLRAATAVAPRDGIVVVPDSGGRIEIVWSAPAAALPVRYFLQVAARDGTPDEIYAGYLDVSAALVRLDQAHRSYAWRVYTVCARNATYAVSPWSAFTSADGTPAHASR